LKQGKSDGAAQKFDRDAPLDNAMEVFWSRGYKAASIDVVRVALSIH
jgi:hypothetical protein